jgi:D-aspartate ligase
VPSALDLDTAVPVLLFKSHRYIIHHGAVGIARNLGQAGVPVYANVEDRWTPLAVSRYLTGSFVLAQTVLDDDDRLLQALLTIGKGFNRPAILLPTDDKAAFFVAEHASELRQRFLFPDVPAGLPRRLADKMSLYGLCGKFGMPCPENVVPQSIEDVHELAGRIKFPVFLKVSAYWSPRGKMLPSQIVENRVELIAICRKVQNWENPNIIVQEYIPGEDWIVHGHYNPKTDCFLPFTGRKVRSYPAFAGFTTLGVSAANETLSSQIEAFVKATGYSGIMDIDCRFDQRDGTYKLLDFNPRIGMNFRMFDDQAGLNVARALHLDLTGRSVKQSPLVEGRVFIVEPYDLLASLSYLRRRKVTLGKLLLALRGSKELAWFSWRDPLPILLMCLRLLLHVASRFGTAGRTALRARKGGDQPLPEGERPAADGGMTRTKPSLKPDRG